MARNKLRQPENASIPRAHDATRQCAALHPHKYEERELALRLRRPCRQRCDPCSAHTLDRRRGLEPRYCIVGSSRFGEALRGDEIDACQIGSWSVFSLELPFQQAYMLKVILESAYLNQAYFNLDRQSSSNTSTSKPNHVNLAPAKAGIR